MLGLWSRPIRGGTLKYLMLSLWDAPTVLIALNRFVRFWNLILDDYKLQMSRQADGVRVALLPRKPDTMTMLLGHELMVKLVHGIVSWLLGREIAILRVGFAFARPDHASDYVFLHPGQVRFDARETSIYLPDSDCQAAFKRERHQFNALHLSVRLFTRPFAVSRSACHGARSARSIAAMAAPCSGGME